MQLRRFACLVCFAIFAVSAQAQQPGLKEPAKTNTRPVGAEPAKPEPFDKADVKTMAGQCVSLDTEAGVIEMELYPEHAPETVRNFLNLAATGMFDTTTFSRVVPDFVIQGGDIWSRDGKVSIPMGTRARRTIPDEPNKILHERGVLSMARTDEPNSASTHFFILVKPSPPLDGKFAAFGRVTKGMDVVDAINKTPVTDEKPAKPVRIRKVTVAACVGTRTPSPQ
ncbi:MAG TPA: peptidylprolyl isomerase [Pyrinomonadaceae bacterium]|jgi:peptidyl-prolyl cis-trans isomerase B (cyclophilin B)|nr:peptidylprolyl isomerase [Pyrinomonadaceae bacterium]